MTQPMINVLGIQKYRAINKEGESKEGRIARDEQMERLRRELLGNDGKGSGVEGEN